MYFQGYVLVLMGTLDIQAKNIYLSTTCQKNLQQRNRVREVWSVCIQYLQPEKILAEEYQNRDKSYMLKYIRVVRKEEKRMNRFHQWCIVLYHVYLKDTELYSCELWVKVITEVPGTAYFPIKKLLIKKSNKTEVPL